MFLSYYSYHELNGINDSPETAIVCSGKGLNWWGLQNPENPVQDMIIWLVVTR